MTINCISEFQKIKELYKSNHLKRFSFKLNSIEKFHIRKISDNKCRPMVVTINGFLTENLENDIQWRDSIKQDFPNREWYHLNWDSQQSGKAFATIIQAIFSLQINPFLIANLIKNNGWSIAIRNSLHAGNCLSYILHACNHRPVVLIGHSLGARTIYNCLLNANKIGLKLNIQEIYLLGAAVSADPYIWDQACSNTSFKIYNYYSKEDEVLKFLYPAGTLNSYVAGRHEIFSPCVQNFDATEFIVEHSGYIKHFSFLRKMTNCQ